MDAVDWVRDAFVIVVGAVVVYVLIQAFSETYPGFGEYGWLLMGAYIAGAVLFLKYGLSGKR